MAYRILTGMNYPPDKRAEIGDVVDDLPPKSVKWLLAQGHVEPVEGKGGKPAPAPVVDDEEPAEVEPVVEDAPAADPEDGE